MKKLIPFLLVLASTGNSFAQIAETDLQQKYNQFKELSKTEQFFRMPPWYDQRKFVFQLENKNRLFFYFMQIDQGLQLPNIDSLLRSVWRALQPFSEGFSKPLINHRIDYHIGTSEHRIRTLEYNPPGKVFSIRGNDTLQLKMEQDTLNIRFYSYPGEGAFQNVPQPYYITLLLNNITDIAALAKEDIDWAEATVRSEVTAIIASPDRERYQPTVRSYNVADKKRLQVGPFVPPSEKNEFIPYVQISFQHVRGGWAPSAGVGMEYKWKKSREHTIYVRLGWEPYFFFDRSADKKTELDRVDFITGAFGDRLLENASSRELNYSLYFTAGYAIRTQGNWFKKNTFKISLPGVEYRNVMLYPEFNFHGFFKDFNPSMKLVVNLE